jgi:transcriptional regulator with XRE-family HTH domain
MRVRGNQAYFQELNGILDQVFGTFKGTVLELADASGLSISTIVRLDHRVTKYPRFFTVWKLARATGHELKMLLAVKARRKAG